MVMPQAWTREYATLGIAEENLGLHDMLCVIGTREAHNLTLFLFAFS